jgi:hypothetical protein
VRCRRGNGIKSVDQLGTPGIILQNIDSTPRIGGRNVLRHGSAIQEQVKSGPGQACPENFASAHTGKAGVATPA